MGRFSVVTIRLIWDMAPCSGRRIKDADFFRVPGHFEASNIKHILAVGEVRVFAEYPLSATFLLKKVNLHGDVAQGNVL